MDDLAQFLLEVRQLNIDKGWRELSTTFGEYVALLHSEVSEMLEAFRDRGIESYTTPEGRPDDVGSEMADVLIRLLDMADIYSIDLTAEYRRKMQYNKTRAWRHGGRTL